MTRGRTDFRALKARRDSALERQFGVDAFERAYGPTAIAAALGKGGV